MTGELARKEWLQSRIAVGAAPILLIMAAIALHFLSRTQLQYVYQVTSILAEEAQAISTISCAVVAFVIGVKVFAEAAKPGRFAFLRHRPISPGRIFLAKLAIAAGIYTAVVAPTLLLTILFAAWPGRFPAPFLPQLALPYLADLLCGYAYILAAAIVVCREARWFGSKIMPLGLAVCCSVVSWLPSFWMAMAGVVIGITILLLAAYSSFKWRYVGNRQRPFAKIPLALTLLPAAIGICVLPSAAAWYVPLTLPPGTGHSLGWKDDTLVLTTWGGSNTKTTYRPALDASAPQQEISGLEFSRISSGTSLVWDMKAAGMEYMLSYNAGFRVPQRLYGIPQASAQEVWMYVYPWQCMTGYRLEFDGWPAQTIGYVGRNGRVDRREDVVPFEAIAPMWTIGGYLIVEPHRVLDGRQSGAVSEILEVTNERLVTAGLYRTARPSGDVSGHIVTSDRAVYILGEQQKRIRYEHPRSDLPRVTAYVGPSGSVHLLYLPNIHNRTTNYLYVQLDSAGKEIARLELPALPGHDYQHHRAMDWRSKLEACSFPPVLLYVASIFEVQTRAFLPYVLAISLLSALFAFVTTRGLWWTTIGSLLGPAGLLLMWWMRSRSVRMIQQRSVDRSICIFEPARSEVTAGGAA